MSTEEKIKVLHVVCQMGHGGIETFLMSMLRNYDRDKYHMDILYTGPQEGDYADEVRSLGSKMISCPLKYDQVRFVYSVKKILKDGGYGAVNNHLSDIGGGAILAAKLAGVPARVSSYHTNLLKRKGAKKFYMEIMRRLTLKTATGITTSSPDVTDSHFQGFKVPKGLVQSISYGVDVSNFSKTNSVEPLPELVQSSENLVVGHIGHYTPQKNHDALIKIASLVVKELPSAKFVLCGSGGDLREQVEQKIKDSGLSEHVLQVQGLSDIRQFYSSIDVFILPSRHEGMPISIIEAQAAGRPVVASDLEGIRIATADEMKENLFSIDDVEPFSKCLIDLLNNKDKRLSQGNAGKSFAENYFDIKLAVRKYEQLYLP